MQNLIKHKWTLKEPIFIKKEDQRYPDAIKELKELSFSQDETWCLYTTLAQFILPRLKYFRDVKANYPAGLTQEEWTEILDKMIFAFEWALIEDEMTEEYRKMSDKEKDKAWERYKEGMTLFSKWFMGLWW